MKFSAKVFLTLLILVVITGSIVAQTYDLRLHLVKGQKYDQSITTNLNLAQDMAGIDVKVDTRIHFVFAQEVQSIDGDGNYVIQSTYKQIAVDMDALGSQLHYDSEKKATVKQTPEEADIAAAFDNIIGKKYTVVLSPKSKVIRVEGIKAIYDQLSKKANPMMMQVLSGAFDDKKMEASYASAYDFFPEVPVKKGDTWNRSSSVEAIFPIHAESSYTLKEVTGNIATIGMATEIAVKNDSMEVSGMQVKLDIKGTYSGDYHLDLRTGLGTSASLTMPVKGSMEMLGMTVPLDLVLKMDMSATEVK